MVYTILKTIEFGLSTGKKLTGEELFMKKKIMARIQAFSLKNHELKATSEHYCPAATASLGEGRVECVAAAISLTRRESSPCSI